MLKFFSVLAMSVMVAACGATFADLEAAAAKGDVDASIRLCQADARAAFYVDQKSEDEALAIYDACVAKIGKK